MEDAGDPLKWIDLPGQFLDRVVQALVKVGIELPALMLQVFLLALVLLALFVIARPLIADWRNAKLLPMLGAGAVALVALGIVFGIGSQLLLPDRVAGRVASADLTGVKVELLDFRNQPISTGGTADSQTGEFIAFYSPAWNGPARTLRISAPACKPRDQALARGRLARGSENTWEFACEKA